MIVLKNKLIRFRKLESLVVSKPLKTDFRHSTIRYRGWLISTKLVDGKLWLQWQHPSESFPRYGTPLIGKHLAETIRHARFLIDLTIKLEQESEQHPVYPKPASLKNLELK